MLPLFTVPLAFAGLAALPALAAVYLLRNRAKPRTVSSLLLWADLRPAPQGGRRVDRLRPPPVFWLELLILALLALAAAGPHFPAAAGRPLVVVLDDSFSMRAGSPDSPRGRAADALRAELGRHARGSVKLVLAGDRPQLLGGQSRAVDAESLLDQWACGAPSARLDAAVAFALELGGDLCTVLVVTDRPPPTPPAAGRVRWWAFGTPRGNAAFVNAGRDAGPRGDRILLEVANLSKEPRAATLRVDAVDPPAELRRSELQLAAGQTQRVVLELPEGTQPTIRAALSADDLPFDDVVTLLPADRRPVRTEIAVADAAVRRPLERAVAASGVAAPAGARPHVVFLSGDAPSPPAEETWVVRFLTEPEAEAFTGPFVLDRAHPLADGLSLAGAVWGAGKGPLTGVPVVMAGNTSLVTDAETAGGRHEVRVRLRPELSTLFEAPAWPALVSNVLRWRGSQLPGVDRPNVRLGEEVNWTLLTAAEAATVTPPAGEALTLPVRGRRVAARAEVPGVTRLVAGPESAAFAANPLSRDESDLRGAETGEWGGAPDATTLRLEYRDSAWALVLLALALAAGHLWLLHRGAG